MKVHELIEALKEIPQNIDVVVFETPILIDIDKVELRHRDWDNGDATYVAWLS